MNIDKTNINELNTNKTINHCCVTNFLDKKSSLVRISETFRCNEIDSENNNSNITFVEISELSNWYKTDVCDNMYVAHLNTNQHHNKSNDYWKKQSVDKVPELGVIGSYECLSAL